MHLQNVMLLILECKIFKDFKARKSSVCLLSYKACKAQNMEKK